jgi:hypothetical protein
MASRISPLALAGLTVAGGVNFWLLTEVIGIALEDPPPVERETGAPRLTGPDDPAAIAKPIASYQQTLARPLFFKTREPFVARPAPPPPVQAPKPAPPPTAFVDPGISLAGIMISGQARKAYLVRKPDPNGAWVREGEDFMGWKVQSISAGAAKLQQSDRTIELQLYAER